MRGARTLARWLAFFRFSPFGGRRDDERASVLARTVAIGTITRKDKRAHRLSDFGLVPPSSDEASGPKDWRQAKAMVRTAFGGGA